jgi:hypothetical protein
VNSPRALTLLVAAISALMAVTSGAMAMRAATPLQLITAAILFAVSALSLLLLLRGHLLRWLAPSVLSPAFRVLGGTFCLAIALITSVTERPPFLSFSQLHAAWLLLVGGLLLVTVVSDWLQWRG